MVNKNYWDLAKRPHTKLKLEIYKKYLKSWCTIFKRQKWAKEIFIVDCFAGRGNYDLESEKGVLDGSPLITVKIAKEFQDKFNAQKQKSKEQFRIKCIFIEKSKNNINYLNNLLKPYLSDVDIEIIEGDFNNVIKNIVKNIGNKPALFFVDPFGIKTLKKESVQSIVSKKGAKDILLNYIQEGVERIEGLAKKRLKECKEFSVKEIKTIKNLYDFMGHLECIGKNEKAILNMYVEEVLKGNNVNVGDNDKLDVIAFGMPYPHKRDIIYYLLFASRNKSAIKIVRNVYASCKKTNFNDQQSLFDTNQLSKLHNEFNI
ncbi:three-Cys-motif partner protein TcmP [Patescibacteria group bacterium]|nr:three-Cys-motif partner protein TcmP [Patescibacteria group bacterium]MBU1683687.1 three-Cys-motif partner protein TcmP [Patescibacteria group bacterium]